MGSIKVDLVTVFNNVMAGLMTADGMHKEDVLGDKSYSGDRLLMTAKARHTTKRGTASKTC